MLLLFVSGGVAAYAFAMLLPVASGQATPRTQGDR
jgi:hypothetical protein